MLQAQLEEKEAEQRAHFDVMQADLDQQQANIDDIVSKGKMTYEMLAESQKRVAQQLKPWWQQHFLIMFLVLLNCLLLMK